MPNTKEVFVMTEREKNIIVQLFVKEYQKGKEKNDERESKNRN